MDDADGIGELVSGAAAARAVEPEAGEGAQAHAASCLNCGTPLTGPHCHQCGQAGHVHRTIAAWWHDLAHGVLHLDGKIWRTLPLLALKPGELTRRYVAGERAKFVSPIAIFLFSVFLMFAVFSMVGGPVGGGSPADGANKDSAAELAEAQQAFRRKNAETQAELDKLGAERTRLAAAGQSTTEVDEKIADAKQELLVERDIVEEALEMMGDGETSEAEGSPQPGVAKRAAEQAAEGNFVVVSGADSLNAWLNNAYKKAKENPSLLIYKLQNNAYKFSWALIPISVPFVWMLFLHRRRYRQYRGYDHTVFVTYSIAFMSLGAIALSLLRALGFHEAFAGLAMLIVPPLHMYRQLRGAYGLSRFSAIWRTFVLVNVTGMTLGLFFLLLLALGVLG
jgi:hypothetical protein